MTVLDSVVGSMVLAAVLAVFSVVAAVTGQWAIAALAYVDAIGMTALAAVARSKAEEL